MSIKEWYTQRLGVKKFIVQGSSNGVITTECHLVDGRVGVARCADYMHNEEIGYLWSHQKANEVKKTPTVKEMAAMALAVTQAPE